MEIGQTTDLENTATDLNSCSSHSLVFLTPARVEWLQQNDWLANMRIPFFNYLKSCKFLLQIAAFVTGELPSFAVLSISFMLKS